MIPTRKGKGYLPFALAAISASTFLAIVGGTCYQPHDNGHELRNPLLTPAIEMRADADGLEDLRTVVLKPDDIEIRVWGEPTALINVAEGYVLRRVSNEWTGRHLLAVEKRPRVSASEHVVAIQPPPGGEAEAVQVEPLNGWEFLWKSLTATGLLFLPDESALDLKTDRRTKEGNIHIVEIKTSGEYRTYRYTTPEHYDLPETRAMVQIVRILHAEFSKDQQQ